MGPDKPSALLLPTNLHKLPVKSWSVATALVGGSLDLGASLSVCLGVNEN